MGSLPLSLASIALGATLGAWLRWGFSLWLNARLQSLPLGTLVANLIGAYLIGMAVGFFNDWPQLSPEWRLLAITGFLGGLTTFSTFPLRRSRCYSNGITLLPCCIREHICLARSCSASQD